MNDILFFVLGLLVGGTTGFSLMCLISFNRISEYEKELKNIKRIEKKNSKLKEEE